MAYGIEEKEYNEPAGESVDQFVSKIKNKRNTINTLHHILTQKLQG